MTRYGWFLPLALALTGCGRPSEPENELKLATSVTLSYRFHGAPYPTSVPKDYLHSVTVDDPRQIRELVGLLVVTERSHWVPGDVPNGILRFQLPGGDVAQCCFGSHPRQISLGHPDAPKSPFWLLDLKDRRFYDKCVELARKHEGGPVYLLSSDTGQ
jgi:hypothetical protein